MERTKPYFMAPQFQNAHVAHCWRIGLQVPVNNTIENWHIHQRLKIPSRLIVFPEENHWILKAENSKFHYKEIREWLAKYLK